MTRTPSENFLSALKPGAVCRFRCMAWCPDWTPRTVIRVRSNDVSFNHPTRTRDDGSPIESWLNFPKAGEVTEPEPGVFVIADADLRDPRYLLEYDFRGTEGGGRTMTRPDYTPRDWDSAEVSELRDAPARTLWISIYADAAEQWRDDARDDARRRGDDVDPDDGPPRAGSGEDWDDIVPVNGPDFPEPSYAGAPREVVRAADSFLARLGEHLKRDADRLRTAADAVDPAVTLPTATDCLERAVREWCGLTGRDAERMGHCLALQAQGHGVGLSDDVTRMDGRAFLARMRTAIRATAGPIEHSLSAFWDGASMTMDVDYVDPSDLPRAT